MTIGSIMNTVREFFVQVNIPKARSIMRNRDLCSHCKRHNYVIITLVFRTASCVHYVLIWLAFYGELMSIISYDKPFNYNTAVLG